MNSSKPTSTPGTQKRTPAPIFEYVALSAVIAITQASGSAAILYVNYPVKVVFRAASTFGAHPSHELSC